MKFDLRTHILGFDGKPLTEVVKPTDGEQQLPGQPFKKEIQNFRSVLHAAIYRQDPSARTRTPEEVERIGELSLKIWKRWKITLDHKDCDFILEKAKVSFASDPLYYIRLKEFLNGQEPDIPEEYEEEEPDQSIEPQSDEMKDV